MRYVDRTHMMKFNLVAGKMIELLERYEAIENPLFEAGLCGDIYLTAQDLAFAFEYGIEQLDGDDKAKKRSWSDYFYQRSKDILPEYRDKTIGCEYNPDDANKKITREQALEMLQDALNIDGGGTSLKTFAHKISVSDMPPDEKNFFLCICNDFEDLKVDFFGKVKNFVEDNEELSAGEFSKLVKSKE